MIPKQLLFLAVLALSMSAVAAPVTLTVTSSGVTTNDAQAAIPAGSRYDLTAAFTYDTDSLNWQGDYEISGFSGRFVVGGHDLSPLLLESPVGPLSVAFSQVGNTASFGFTAVAIGDVRFSTDLFVTWHNDRALPAAGQAYEVSIANPVTSSAHASSSAWGETDYYFELAPEAVRISVSAVPEPQTWAMMLAGLGLAGFAARRRAKVA